MKWSSELKSRSLAKATPANPDYLTTSEREAVLQDISRASGIYKSCSAEQN